MAAPTALCAPCEAQWLTSRVKVGLPSRAKVASSITPRANSPRSLASRSTVASGAGREQKHSASGSGREQEHSAPEVSRRELLTLPATTGAMAAAAAVLGAGASPQGALAEDGAAAPSTFTNMPALQGKDYGKSKMKYPDYTETPSGLQYKDLREGSGPPPKEGDTVVIDWDGFTIGYYGRIFEARNKAKGGSFEGGEKDFFRFRVGANEVIPAFNEAIATMQVGAIRRIIVPPEIGYPNNDFSKVGPRPLTFSGQRALDFVLKNQGLIDKTLLFDIELLRIVPS